jgi:hypothetical protein
MKLNPKFFSMKTFFHSPYLVLLLFTVFCTSCEQAQQTNIDFILFEKGISDVDMSTLDLIVKVAAPFENICGDKPISVGFIETTIKRNDLSKESKVTFLDDKKGNADKIKYIIREFGNKYKENLKIALNTEGSVANAADLFRQYNTKQENIIYFTFSDTDPDTGIVKGADKLREAIQAKLCANYTKLLADGKLTKDEKLEKITVVIKPKSAIEQHKQVDPENESNVVSTDLQKALLELADGKVNPDERLQKVDAVFDKYFDSSASVKRVTAESKAIMQVWDEDNSGGAKGYLMRLTALNTIESITIIESPKDNTGKITGLTVTEKHKDSLSF